MTQIPSSLQPTPFKDYLYFLLGLEKRRRRGGSRYGKSLSERYLKAFVNWEPSLSEKEQERTFFNALGLCGRGSFSYEGSDSKSDLEMKLFCIHELCRRYALYRENQRRLSGNTSQDLSTFAGKTLARIPAHYRIETEEWLLFVPIYRGGEIGDPVVFEKGCRTHVNTDPARLFSILLTLQPEGFVLVHNHPGGDSTPSSSDYELTLQVAELSENFGLCFFGHWVVSLTGEHWIDSHRTRQPARERSSQK
jgi:hypothetical protein